MKKGNFSNVKYIAKECFGAITVNTYHGQVTGIFTGDEVLAGKNPSQGTELCAVVEYMFSLETFSKGRKINGGIFSKDNPGLQLRGHQHFCCQYARIKGQFRVHLYITQCRSREWARSVVIL